jgi:hypothetical protein
VFSDNIWIIQLNHYYINLDNYFNSNDVNSYNLITTNATNLSTLNVVGDIIGSGTALTNLNYDSITKTKFNII